MARESALKRPGPSALHQKFADAHVMKTKAPGQGRVGVGRGRQAEDPAPESRAVGNELRVPASM